MRPVRIKPLGLRVGDLVEVRSEQEILATLDEQGTLDGMPFMPEMLPFCGKRVRVEKRAHKTCNTITVMESRRLHDTVHLEGLRCDGKAHGGCQADCLMFWKEAWLKRLDEASRQEEEHIRSSPDLRCDRTRLAQLTLRSDPPTIDEPYYRCQVTELLKASAPLPWWDIRQYWRDYWSGNVGLISMFKVLLFRVFLELLHIGVGYRALLWTYDRFQKWRGGTPYPLRTGHLDKTPRETLDLLPGELVQIRPYEEILETLSKKNKNRGLWFGPEMVPYCGEVHRVRARVEHIIEESTGRMMRLPGECVILEGVICRAEYSENRLFCPRNLFPFWREIWLRRVEKRSGTIASQ
jgi:hypothetical protein